MIRYLAASLLALFWCTQAHAAVDVALLIGIDASSSIDEGEYRLQYDGIATALQDPKVMEAISSGYHRQVAVAIYEWSDKQQVVLPWVVLNGPESIKEVATALRRHSRHKMDGNNTTSISSAIQYGVAMMGSAPESEKQVLNVVGDGIDNVMGTAAVQAARDAANDRGIFINGMVIEDGSGIASHYQDNVIGPAGMSFVVEVPDYDHFVVGIRRKLILEIAIHNSNREERHG